MSEWERFSGETWFLHSGHAQHPRSIQVIESVPKPPKKRKRKPKKVAFGFSRALPKGKK